MNQNPLGDAATWAAEHAAALMAPLGARWRHVQGVALRAREVAPSLAKSERTWLIAAAYLHDIGYASCARDTGLHQLDGARHLRGRGVDDRLCALVAHHSCAIFEAEERGLGSVLMAEFLPERSEVADALAYCDLTTSGEGERITLEERLASIYARYGPETVVARAVSRAEGCFREAVRATEQRLASLSGYSM